MQAPKYKRVLIKLSGEVLAGEDKTGISEDVLKDVCEVIKACYEMGVQVGIVVGGGNFWRGLKNGKEMDRTRADHIGMLATAMNSIALADCLEHMGVEVRVQTAIEMRAIAEPYIRLRAVRHLEKGRVVIFGCGLGHPFFSTDTAAVLRGAEIGAEIVLLAKNIDGIYDSDPRLNSDAKKFDRITYQEIIKRGLSATDLTATSFSMDNRIPILLFEMKTPANILRAICGENIGTTVTME